MYTAQRFPADESLQAFDTQCKFPQCQGPLVPETARPKPAQILLVRVVRAVNDPQILVAAAFHRRLSKAPSTSKNVVKRLHHHAFASLVGERQIGRASCRESG